MAFNEMEFGLFALFTLLVMLVKGASSLKFGIVE
jgi:hypothetical protein